MKTQASTRNSLHKWKLESLLLLLLLPLLLSFIPSVSFLLLLLVRSSFLQDFLVSVLTCLGFLWAWFRNPKRPGAAHWPLFVMLPPSRTPKRLVCFIHETGQSQDKHCLIIEFWDDQDARMETIDAVQSKGGVERWSQCSRSHQS